MLRKQTLILFVVIGLHGLLNLPAVAGSGSDVPEYIALVTAYDPEIDALIAALEDVEGHRWTGDQQIVGVHFKTGEIHGKPILVFATQMSIANAAMSMQVAFSHFNVSQVLYAGIAGGVNPELEKGDVVVVERWFYHDESAYFNPEPSKPGEYIVADYFKNSSWYYEENRPDDPHLPHYENFGMIFPDDVLIVRQGEDDPEPVSYFSATPSLLRVAESVAERAEFDFDLAVGGNAVTGSVFVDNAEYREWLRRVWKAEVTEMESAAVGQVCTINEIPWVIIRAVSDLAGGQEGKNEENLFDGIASANAAKVLLAMLEAM